MKVRLGHLGRATLMLAFLTGASTPASADWLLTPYAGIAFGGSANFGDAGDFEDNLERRVTFGGSAAWMGAGIIGFEVDLSSTPNFFQTTGGAGDFEFGDGYVASFMGNLVVGAPIGGQAGVGVRPYGTVGLGLLRSSMDGGGLFDDVSSSDLGFNAGAGAHVFFNDNIGLRGDIRYFRAMQGNNSNADFGLDIEDFDFWRGTVGVTFRFGR
jgi:opacity protein-like surface antigen